MTDNGPGRLDLEVDTGALKTRSAHGAAATLIGQLFKFVLKFASTIVMARLLSPGEFGMVALVAPLLAFAAALNQMGFAQAIVQRRDLQPAQVNSLFWLNFALSVGLAALVIIASPIAGMIYREPQASVVLAVMGAMLVVDTLSMIPIAMLNRKMRFIAQMSTDVAGITVNVATTIGAAWVGFSYWSIVMGQLAGGLTTCFMAFLLSSWRPSRPAIAEGVGEMARFGANLTGVNIATYLSMTADNIIIGAVAGKTALGFYERSYTLVVQPLNQLIVPLTRVALPLLSRLVDDAPQYRHTYIQMLTLSLLLTGPAMLSCALLAEPVVLFLWGAPWMPAVPLFFWLALGGVVAPVFITTAWLYTSEGRVRQQLKLSVVTSLISVASFAIGISWGAPGVARLNTLTFILLQTPIMVWGVTTGGIVTLRDIARALGPIAGAVAVTAGALLLVAPHVHGWLVIPIVGMAYGVFGAVVLMLPGGRSLLQMFSRLLASVRGGRPPATPAG